MSFVETVKTTSIALVALVGLAGKVLPSTYVAIAVAHVFKLMVCVQFVTVEDVRILRDIGRECLCKPISFILTSRSFFTSEQFYSTQIVCSDLFCCSLTSNGLRAGRDAGERGGANLSSSLLFVAMYYICCLPVPLPKWDCIVCCLRFEQ